MFLVACVHIYTHSINIKKRRRERGGGGGKERKKSLVYHDQEGFAPDMQQRFDIHKSTASTVSYCKAASAPQTWGALLLLLFNMVLEVLGTSTGKKRGKRTQVQKGEEQCALC